VRWIFLMATRLHRFPAGKKPHPGSDEDPQEASWTIGNCVIRVTEMIQSGLLLRNPLITSYLKMLHSAPRTEKNRHHGVTTAQLGLNWNLHG
jgi:hypothetical protein